MSTESHSSFQWPLGFSAAGVHCGLKPDQKDLALFLSDRPAVTAGTFTTNQVKAAPVKWTSQRVRSGSARAILVNSGNANACTGAQGMDDTKQMGGWAADALKLPLDQVLVCSTGPIGVPLPMQTIQQGIPAAVANLSPGGHSDAAEAIRTTDTHAKMSSTEILCDGHRVILSAVAKGAGMIEPNMATMLAFCFTDAALRPDAAQPSLSLAVEQSFNRITVDGDRSTNDTVLLLANGAAGNEPLHPGHPDWQTYQAALNQVTFDLAMMIVRDGEGATKVVRVEVEGAATDEQAEAAARAVGNSSLIKTSWAGGQANWGRVMDALGYSAAILVEEQVDIDYDGLAAVRGGIAAGTPQPDLDRVTDQASFTLHISLHQGSGRAVVYSCDTTEEYVRINVEE